MARVVTIRWCKEQPRGVRFIEPNEELAKEYLNAAEESLDALRAVPAMHAAEIRIATVWWKPARNRTGITPHYWLHRTAQWLVFPHELCGLDASEILREKPGAAVLSQRLQPGS